MRFACTAASTSWRWADPMSVSGPAPATPHPKTHAPVITQPAWPLVVKDNQGHSVTSGVILASVSRREEKGSDVNVASHLLIDAIGGAIDAAIVFTNDSDLEFPIQHVRTLVPVGLVNPTRNHLAGALAGRGDDGVGGHWWARISVSDLTTSQLPDPVGTFAKPHGW